MSEESTVVKLEVPIQLIANRIRAAEQRVERDWIEGSIELGVNFLAARERFGGDNRAFGRWIKDEGFTTRANDRAGLINMARDVVLMRECLTKTRYRCYESIWLEAKPTYTERGIMKKAKQNQKKKTPPMTDLHRQVKLEGVYDRIGNTSLGTPKEMDALINLTQAHPEMAEKLVERATNGEAVSAVAACAELDRKPRASSIELIEVWTKHAHRLLAAWLRASDAEQDAFIKYLEEHRHA